MTAAEKIRSELSGAKLSAKGKAVVPSVAEALVTFCAQNAEFAQAVEQSGKTAAECVESTVRGLRNCDPTAEARAFVEQYKQYIKEIFRKKARKTA